MARWVWQFTRPGDSQLALALYLLIATLFLQFRADLLDLALLGSDILPRHEMPGLEYGDILYEHPRKIGSEDKKDCRFDR